MDDYEEEERGLTSAGREAEEDRKDNESRRILAHGDEEEDEDAGEEALRREDRERAICIRVTVVSAAGRRAADASTYRCRRASSG